MTRYVKITHDQWEGLQGELSFIKSQVGDILGVVNIAEAVDEGVEDVEAYRPTRHDLTCSYLDCRGPQDHVDDVVPTALTLYDQDEATAEQVFKATIHARDIEVANLGLKVQGLEYDLARAQDELSEKDYLVRELSGQVTAGAEAIDRITEECKGLREKLREAEDVLLDYHDAAQPFAEEEEAFPELTDNSPIVNAYIKGRDYFMVQLREGAGADRVAEELGLAPTDSYYRAFHPDQEADLLASVGIDEDGEVARQLDADASYHEHERRAGRRPHQHRPDGRPDGRGHKYVIQHSHEHPGAHTHHDPTVGTPRNPGKLWEQLVEEGPD